MSKIQTSLEPQGLGILALRHDGYIQKGFSLSMRGCLIGTTVYDRDDRSGGLGSWVRKSTQGNHGDLNNWHYWRADPDLRPIGQLSFATPAIIAPLADPSKNKTTQGASAGRLGCILDAAYAAKTGIFPLLNSSDTDRRFVPFELNDKARHFSPSGTRGIMLSGTWENEQRNIFLAADGRLAAPNRNSGRKFGTPVYDLTPEGAYDEDRYSRLQRAWRVIRPTPERGPDEGYDLAWQIGADGCGRTTPGYVYDQTGAVGMAAGIVGGPWQVGDGGKHVFGQTLDGEPIFPVHIQRGALFVGGIGDGPLNFEDQIWNPSPVANVPRWPVHLRWDPRARHLVNGRIFFGAWKWEAEVPVYFPSKDRCPPPKWERPPGGEAPPIGREQIPPGPQFPTGGGARKIGPIEERRIPTGERPKGPPIKPPLPGQPTPVGTPIPQYIPTGPSAGAGVPGRGDGGSSGGGGGGAGVPGINPLPQSQPSRPRGRYFPGGVPGSDPNLFPNARPRTPGGGFMPPGVGVVPGDPSGPLFPNARPRTPGGGFMPPGVGIPGTSDSSGPLFPNARPQSADGGTTLGVPFSPDPPTIGAYTPDQGTLPYLATTMEFGAPAFLGRPQNLHSTAPDLRNARSNVNDHLTQIDDENPITFRMEAYGAQGGTIEATRGEYDVTASFPGDPFDRVLSGCTKYSGGTGNGGAVVAPPEVDMANYFSSAPTIDPVYSRIQAGGNASMTYQIFAPGTWQGVGLPDAVRGSSTNSVFWGSDGAGPISGPGLLQRPGNLIWYVRRRADYVDQGFAEQNIDTGIENIHPAMRINLSTGYLELYSTALETWATLNTASLGANRVFQWPDHPGYITVHDDSFPSRGDILYRSTTLDTDPWSRLAIGAANRILSSSGTLPQWSTLASLSIPTGTGVNDQVAVWSGANTLDGSANLTFDGTALTALQYLRVGTALDAAAQGDFSAGQSGGGRIVWDQSSSILRIFNFAGGESARVYGSTVAGRGFFWFGAVSGSNPIAFSNEKVIQGANTFARSFDSAPSIDAGGSVTTFIGAILDNPGGTGTITNCYGIHVVGQTKGGTLNRAIYCAGSADGVEIASYVRVGGSVPAGFASQGDFIAGSSTAYVGYDNSADTTVLTGGLTVNESGADLDTRIEGNAVTDLLFVDAGQDRVGINTSTPAGKLAVEQPDTIGGLPVLYLLQDDISEEFIRLRGVSDAAVLTQSLVDAADVSAFTTKGYLKIHVIDFGGAITDQAYYVPFGTVS